MSFIAQHLSTDLLPVRQQLAAGQEEFGRAVLDRDAGPLGDRPFRTVGKPDVPVTDLYDPMALALGDSCDGAAPSETRS